MNRQRLWTKVWNLAVWRAILRRVDEADRVRRYVIITSVIIVGCVERHSMRRLDPRCCSTLRTLNKRMIHAEQCITVHYIAVK